MAKKKKKARKQRKLKPAKLKKSLLITIKVTEAEHDLIFSRADKYAKGNVSRFIRHATETCRTKAP